MTMSKTWFDRRGKKRTGSLTGLDTPFEREQAVQGYETELTYQHEDQYLDDFGAPKKGKPEVEITAGGNS